jgi:hypothetical protein
MQRMTTRSHNTLVTRHTGEGGGEEGVRAARR